MADTLTTTSALNNLLKHFFVPTAIRTLLNETPLYEFAQKDAQPGKSGNITYWNAWLRIAGVSSVTSEGGAASLGPLSSRRVGATIAQYTKGVKLTDLAQFMAVLDPKQGGRAMLMGSAKETMEYISHMGIYKNDINKNRVKTTNLSSYISSVVSGFCALTGTHNGDIQFQFPAIFATSCGRLSAVSKTAPSLSAQLSVYALRKVGVALDEVTCDYFPDGYRVAYTTPRAIKSLRTDPTWQDWNKYQNSKETMYKAEAGMVEGFRVVMSQLAPAYRVAAHSVSMVFCFGPQAFGVTDIQGGIEWIVVDTPDSGNPFNTFMSLGYKINGAAAMLNPSAGRILFVHEKN
jgi:N4-gp56 family major capsid protein